MRHRPLAAGVVLATCLTTTALAAQSVRGVAGASAQAPSLPGGASQLQETHGDWRVVCAQEGDRRLCAVTQQQVQKESGQLVIRVELEAKPGDSVEGTIVLPFGLAVDQPVTLLLDDARAITQPFRTCLPIGCVIALSLNASRVALFRKAAVLTVKTATVSPGQEVSFRISLNGFASALARTAYLTK